MAEGDNKSANLLVSGLLMVMLLFTSTPTAVEIYFVSW